MTKWRGIKAATKFSGKNTSRIVYSCTCKLQKVFKGWDILQETRVVFWLQPVHFVLPSKWNTLYVKFTNLSFHGTKNMSDKNNRNNKGKGNLKRMYKKWDWRKNWQGALKITKLHSSHARITHPDGTNTMEKKKRKKVDS